MSIIGHQTNLLALDSITQLTPNTRGQAVLAASHGGLYSAGYALRGGAAAVVLHDAGIGLDKAGIAGLDLLAQVGMAGATIDYRSARIGCGADCLARGIISHINAPARVLGLTAGMTASAALALLVHASPPRSDTASIVIDEARMEWLDAPDGVPVHLLDSNSLVDEQDRNAIVITGSHGGLLGGRAESAIKIAAFAAAYNDAGIGIDQAGISRLAALDARDIAGVTVSAASARIGVARSTLEDGIISHCNATARQYGAETGLAMRQCTLRFAEAWRKIHRGNMT